MSSTTKRENELYNSLQSQATNEHDEELKNATYKEVMKNDHTKTIETKKQWKVYIN